jgi:hypothetical protein
MSSFHGTEPKKTFASFISSDMSHKKEIMVMNGKERFRRSPRWSKIWESQSIPSSRHKMKISRKILLK